MNSDTSDDSDHEPEALVGSPTRQLCYHNAQTEGGESSTGASLTEIVRYRNPKSPIRRANSDGEKVSYFV